MTDLNPEKSGSWYSLQRPIVDDDWPVFAGLAITGVLALFVGHLAGSPGPETRRQFVDAPSTEQPDVEPIPEISEPPEVPSPAPTPPDLPFADIDPLGFHAPVPIQTTSFISLFGNGHNRKIWYEADYAGEGHYLVDFSPDNVNRSANGLQISVVRKPDTDTRNKWTAAEVSTHQQFGHGRYEVVMRPSDDSGVISSFFTYTGPYFGDPQDEIDIEFVGKNTGQVEFNTFNRGRSRGHYKYDLGFEAAKSLNLYAFEWHPDRIVWFVNGEEVYELNGDASNLPSNPGKLYMNIWTGTPISWHGRPTFGDRSSAFYACASFRAFDTESRECSDLYLDKIMRRRADEIKAERRAISELETAETSDDS